VSLASVGRHLIERGLKGPLVEREQDLSGLHVVAFLKPTVTACP